MREAKISETSKMSKHPNVEIAVKNFGPIAEANIDLRPLTVFVGASNTGKTYFATLIYTLQSIYGEFSRFPKHIEKTERCEPWTHQDTVETTFKRCFDVKSISDLVRFCSGDDGSFEVLLNVGDVNQEGLQFTLRSGDSRVTLNENTETVSPLHPPPERNSAKCHYLPAARSGILQSSRVVASSLMDLTLRSDDGHSEIPTLSAVIVDFMRHLTLYEENKRVPEIQRIADALESKVLAGKIVVTVSHGGYPKYNYCPDGSDQEVSLTRTAAMVSELAPLVLFLRSLVRPGDTLIIEEPEAHLHPGAQADMAVILARLARAGVRVIVTTHSDWLLQEIGNLVLEGLLEDETDQPPSWLLPNEVGVWHFQKDKPVKEIPFKPREGISPEDYEDVAEGLYNRSVNLQQRFEKKKGEGERESS